MTAPRCSTSTAPAPPTPARDTTPATPSCSGAAPSRASNPTSVNPSPGINNIAGAAPCTAASRE